MRVEPPTRTTSSICSGFRSGIFHGLLAGADGAIDDGLNQLFVLLARDLAAIVLAAGEFDVELDGGFGRERDLGVDDGFADGLHGFGVAAKVEIEVAANVVEGDRDQQVVDVVAAEMRVAVGGDDFEDSVVQLEDGDVEGAAAEIVDGDDAVLFLVEAVGERCGGRFVDQAEDFESGDAAGVFRGLALRVVEVGGNGDDGFRDWLAEVAFGVALELAKNQRGNFRRREGLVAQRDAEHFAGLQVVGEAEGEELQFFLNVFEPRPMRRLME